MSPRWKNLAWKIIEFVALPVIAIIFVLWVLAIWSPVPTANSWLAGNGGFRFAGFYGNTSVHFTAQTEPTAAHGITNPIGPFTVSGILGSGMVTGNQWPSGIGAGTQDIIITGDQNGRTAKVKTYFAGS